MNKYANDVNKQIAQIQMTWTKNYKKLKYLISIDLDLFARKNTYLVASELNRILKKRT